MRETFSIKMTMSETIPIAFFVIFLTATLIDTIRAENLMEITVKCPKDAQLRAQITRKNANDNFLVRCGNPGMRK